MSVLILRVRREDALVALTLEQLRALLENGEKGKLPESGVHDRLWLEQILAWTPKEGLPVREQAKLYSLRLRLSELGKADGEELQLTDQEEEEIWARLNHESFLVGGLSPGWAAFVLDYCRQLGRQFSTIKAR